MNWHNKIFFFTCGGTWSHVCVKLYGVDAESDVAVIVVEFPSYILLLIGRIKECIQERR